MTTNFDRIFDHVITADGLSVPTFAAPMLPVPKRSKWNGIAYLHCQLPEPLDQPGLDRLIVTSGDFGLAYLAERWAARFVSELLQRLQRFMFSGAKAALGIWRRFANEGQIAFLWLSASHVRPTWATALKVVCPPAE